MQTSIFSVDVEDWFHILDVPSAPALAEWSSLPSRVEKNFSKLMDIFSEEKVHVTCFVLGLIGERFPQLVKEAAARGHEIASHGYGHRLVYEQSREDFYEDVRHARLLLQDIAGAPVSGYRAPGFSTTEQTPWFFDVLAEAGYQYDSSVFPAARGHGGTALERQNLRLGGPQHLKVIGEQRQFAGRLGVAQRCGEFLEFGIILGNRRCRHHSG